MDQNRGGGDPEYVFVQTVVVRSARQTHWLERTLGKGHLQEVRSPNPVVPPSSPLETARLPERGSQSRSGGVDFWINAIAACTLAAFLLSLYLLR